MIVQNNIIAMNVGYNIKKNDLNIADKYQKLSSGYRINKTADDAAGLTISEKMRSQIRGLDQATNNILNATNLLRTAEGGMAEIQDIIHRIRWCCSG